MMAGPIVVTGGGTGGHIFPMRAIGEQLVAMGVPATSIHYVGSRRGQESSLLAGQPIDLTLLPGRGIRRSWRVRAVAQNLGALAGLAAAFIVASIRIGRWRPSVVVSVGGYAAAAVGAAAVLWRRPLVLVELDAAPGAVHRILGRFARRRCLAYGPGDDRSVVTGVPLDRVLLEVDRGREARERSRRTMDPPIEPGRVVVVAMSGSLGATRVNDAVSDLAQRWSGRTDRTIIHVSGRRDALRVLARRPTTDGLDYRIIEFAAMAPLWAVADVAVCRAGAVTVAELTALGIPSVLVPLPGAPGDHQTRNAQVVTDAGGAVFVRDAACDGAALESALQQLTAPGELERAADAARRLGHRDAASAVARVVLEVGGWTT